MVLSALISSVAQFPLQITVALASIEKLGLSISETMMLSTPIQPKLSSTFK